MKKIFMSFIVFLSVLLVGCVTDSKTSEKIEQEMSKDKILNKGNDFILSFDKNGSLDTSCRTHIVVKKDSKVMLDKTEYLCLNDFNIKYNPDLPNSSLLYSDFSLQKRNIDGKNYAKYSLYSEIMHVQNFKSSDGETSIEHPIIVKGSIMKNVLVEIGKPIIIKKEMLVFEITYYK